MNVLYLLCGLVLSSISFPTNEAARDPLTDPGLNPRNQDRYDKTLVLDLDETLVYTRNPWEGVQIRDNAVETLKYLESTGWEIIFWTAGSQDYADAIKNIFRRAGVTISGVLSSDHCERIKKSDGYVHFIKDVARLVDDVQEPEQGLDVDPSRPLHSIVIVDNNAQDAYPKENVLEIHSWFGNYPSRADEPYIKRPKCNSGPDKAMLQMREVLDSLRLTKWTSPDIHMQARIAIKLWKVPESDRLISCSDWFDFSELR